MSSGVISTTEILKRNLPHPLHTVDFGSGEINSLQRWTREIVADCELVDVGKHYNSVRISHDWEVILAPELALVSCRSTPVAAVTSIAPKCRCNIARRSAAISRVAIAFTDDGSNHAGKIVGRWLLLYIY